jgi:radical SAM/Cys-rich protein
MNEMLVALQTGKAMNFDATLRQFGFRSFERRQVATLQINVGKVCNQACHHCHVDAGPKRTESMSGPTAERVMALLERSPTIETVDITGGAPEINPNFRELVIRSRTAGRRVINRCNLTILLESGYESLPEFLAEQRVDITASLPCYTASNVDKQRGKGVFEKSIVALRRLNELGYGLLGSPLQLDLVYNPLGASLPPAQQRLEQDYKRHLREEFGIEFHRLLTITNLPISRFAEMLRRTVGEERYMHLLIGNFNPDTVEHVMCRSFVSVGWDGKLYDCDFNQMLDLQAAGRRTIWDIDSFDEFAGQPIVTGPHCFGCTAGAGSSCGGALQ